MGQTLSTEHNKFSPEGTALKEGISGIKEAYIEVFRDLPIWKFTDKAASSTETSTDLPGATETVETAPKDVADTSPIGRFLKADGFFDVDPRPRTDYIDIEDVHPIFELSNFDTTLLGEEQMQQAWNVFRPALALATKMITAPEARRAFWHRLAFGRLAFDSVTGKQTLVYSEKEEDFSEASHAFDLLLGELAEKLTLYVLTPPELSRAHALMAPNRWSVAWSVAGPDVAEKFLSRSRLSSEPGASEYLDCFCPFIGVAMSIFERALCSSSPIHAGSDRWHKENFIFQVALASDLTHELAHLVYSKRSFLDDDRVGSYVPEPFTFLNDMVAEAGFAWNLWSMGCWIMHDELQTVNGEFVPLLSASSWHHSYGIPKLYAPVDLRWIQRWFLKETWAEGLLGEEQREATLWGRGPFSSGKHVPRYMIAQCVVRHGIFGPYALVHDVLYVNGHARMTETGEIPDFEDPVLNRYYLGPGTSNADVWWTNFRNAMKRYLESNLRDLSWWREPWHSYQADLHKPREDTGAGDQEQDTHDPRVDLGGPADTEKEGGSGNADEPPKDANEDPKDPTTTEADEGNTADTNEDPSDCVMADPNEDNASDEHELTDIDRLCVQLSELDLDERTAEDPDKFDDPDKLDTVEELCNLLTQVYRPSIMDIVRGLMLLPSLVMGSTSGVKSPFS